MKSEKYEEMITFFVICSALRSIWFENNLLYAGFCIKVNFYLDDNQVHVEQLRKKRIQRFAPQ